ncbi:recombinase family protein [Bacillus toyonensis]|nr:recombinase family protein [Bacillus toyonensis]
MIYGYARVITDKQELDILVKALKEAGATKIFKEKISSTSKYKK